MINSAPFSNICVVEFTRGKPTVILQISSACFPLGGFFQPDIATRLLESSLWASYANSLVEPGIVLDLRVADRVKSPKDHVGVLRCLILDRMLRFGVRQA